MITLREGGRVRGLHEADRRRSRGGGGRVSDRTEK
jgi:hypothetical protein